MLRPSRLSVVMLVACLGAAAAASANQVVILNSGKRLEVESALPVGAASYHLRLVGGGSLQLPASSIRRVSNAATDMPRSQAVMVASATGGAWTGSSGTSVATSGAPAGIPADAMRPSPGRFRPSDVTRMPAVPAGSLSDDVGGNTSSFVSPRALPDGMGASPALRAPQSVASQATSSRPVAGDFRRSMSRGHGSGGAVRAFGSAGAAPMSGGDPGKSPGLPRFQK